LQFVLNGAQHHLDFETVIERVRRAPPELVRTHGVWIEGLVYPVKQAFELASGVPRTEFTSHFALRHLGARGFDLVSRTTQPDGRAAGVAASLEDTEDVGDVEEVATAPGHQWPWEGSVQAVFITLLGEHGWSITAAADTASKARGVDVLAAKDDRVLGAEVKGWPSTGYADPRRANETKRTQPSTQAGHWFSHALLKAMMLLDSHPGHESLVVLPDYPRYRDLAERTQTGRRAANIHVILLTADGTYISTSWRP
jgi:hypothetical protein